jgi:hypothetical protein
MLSEIRGYKIGQPGGKRMWKSAVLSIASLGIAVVAQAQEFKKVTGLLPDRAEFDAPDGHYQHWDTEVLCGANAIRARVVFSRLGNPTTKWPPAVSVVLWHGDKMSDNLVVHLSLVAPKFQPPFAAQLVVTRFDQKNNVEHVTQAQNYAAHFGEDKAFAFSLSWSPAGDVTALVDGEEHTVSLHVPIDHLEVNGSSGAGVIEPLQIGIVGDPSPGDAACKPMAGAYDFSLPRG